MPTLRAKLRRVRRRLRAQRIGQAACTGAATLAVWLLVLLLVDLAMTPARALRLLILAVATGLAAAWLLRRRHPVSASMEEAAERIETQQPRLRGTVLSAWQLDQALAAGGDVGSQAIAQSFLDRAEQQAKQIRPANTAPSGYLLRHAAKTLPVVLVAALVLAANPERTAVFFRRMFGMSGQPYPPRTAVSQVKPGSTSWVEGRPVTLAAAAAGVIPNAGWVKLRYADGSTASVRLTRKGNRFTSPPVVLEQSAEYRVELGQAVSSPHRIRLIRYPRLRIELVGQPPPYSGKPERRVPGKEASFLEGSSIRLLVESSKNLQAIDIRGQDRSLAVDRIGPRQYQARWTLQEDTAWEVKATDTDRLTVAETIQVEADPDAPPVVVLNDGQPELPVRSATQVRLRYRAADDFGTKELRLFQAPPPAAMSRSPAAPDRAGGRPLATVPLSGEPHAEGQVPWDGTNVLSAPGDQLVVYAEVTDTSPAGQSGRSDPVTIRVVGKEEAQRLRQAWAEEVGDRIEAVQERADQAAARAGRGQWDEAQAAQEWCTQELTAIDQHLAQSPPPLDEEEQMGTAGRQLAQLAEAVGAAQEASQRAEAMIREVAESSGEGPEAGPPQDLAELQQTIARRLGESRALADPTAASAPVRDRLADFLHACQQLPPMPQNLARRPQEADARRDFWSQRKRDLEAIEQAMQAAEAQGVAAAAPWVPQAGQLMRDQELSQRIDQTRRALEAANTAKASELERQINQGVDQLAALLPQASPPGPTPPGRGSPGRASPRPGGSSTPARPGQTSGTPTPGQASGAGARGRPSGPAVARPGGASPTTGPEQEGSQGPPAPGLSQQLGQMAAAQDARRRTGSTPGSGAEARQQEAVANQARRLAAQTDRPEVARQLRGAAEAAEAAARAIRQGNATGARSAVASSAESLRKALEALRAQGPPGQEWQIPLPEALRRRVSAFFDRPTPRRYADQLRTYTTHFPWTEPPAAKPPGPGASDD